MTRPLGPALALGALALTLAACSSERDAGSSPAHGERARPATRLTDRLTDPGEASELIGPALLVALAQAKNFHHEAKVYMASGDLPAAVASVRRILSLSFPRGAAEAEDVRNDARALLATLQVKQGELDEAARTIDEGLAQSQRQSFFVANLYTVQGEVHEARAAGHDAAGEDGKAAAAAERRAAIESYDRSIQINERLQKKLVEER